MKTKIFLSLFLTAGMFSCIVPKEARVLKRNTKEWRNSPPVMEAYADTPLSGIFLTLRENGKFEHTSSGMIKSFEAGTWTNNKDTINLSYLNGQQNITEKKKVIIDRTTSILIFEGDNASPQMRMKIMVNNLQ